MSFTTRFRRSRALLGALLLTLAAVAIPTSTASATTPVLVHCTGTQQAHYSPGLTNTTTTQTVTVTDDFSSCLHTVGLSISTMSGQYGPTSFTRQLGCTDLLIADTGTRLIRWSDGSQSVFDFSRTATAVSGNLVFTLVGQISSGLYAGATATEVITLPGLAGLTACDTPPGLVDLNGLVVLDIVGL